LLLQSAGFNSVIFGQFDIRMPFASVVFTGWAALVAWSDCRDRRVANGLVAVGGVAALVCSALHAAPFGTTPAQAAIGASIGFAVLVPFFLLGVMGAADVKVFAAIGAWCGASALLGVWVAATLASALHALVVLAAGRLRSEGGPGWSPWREGRPTFAIGARRSTPYAALLVGAAWLHWLGGSLSLQGAVR
jgi:prepilin peptidase CpaA